MLCVTVVLNIWKEAKRRTFKLMRYVTETVTQPISYIAALLFFCFFSCINLSHSLSLSVLLFVPFIPSHNNFDAASPCTVDGTLEP